MRSGMQNCLVGVATRRSARSLEPLGAGVKARGTGKSAVSRRPELRQLGAMRSC
jgi:hypothetical protein